MNGQNELPTDIDIDRSRIEALTFASPIAPVSMEAAAGRHFSEGGLSAASARPEAGWLAREAVSASSVSNAERPKYSPEEASVFVSRESALIQSFRQAHMKNIGEQN